MLVGLPGAGKSTIGRVLAKKLNRPFLDFDAEIERKSGSTVARIFAEHGEATFRRFEVELTEELRSVAPRVLAPGGGWVTNESVIDLLRPPARLVHLRITPAEAVRRLSRARVVRPLLSVPDPQAAMERLWTARAHLYAVADLEIDVEVNDSQRVMDMIVALAHDLT